SQASADAPPANDEFHLVLCLDDLLQRLPVEELFTAASIERNELGINGPSILSVSRDFGVHLFLSRTKLGSGAKAGDLLARRKDFGAADWENGGDVNVDVQAFNCEFGRWRFQETRIRARKWSCGPHHRIECRRIQGRVKKVPQSGRGVGGRDEENQVGHCYYYLNPTLHPPAVLHRKFINESSDPSPRSPLSLFHFSPGPVALFRTVEAVECVKGGSTIYVGEGPLLEFVNPSYLCRSDLSGNLPTANLTERERPAAGVPCADLEFAGRPVHRHLHRTFGSAATAFS
ncbi:MAG: hypothetical protein BJ554DRAFT_7490, partial [Olpidium bornovanus]